MRQPASTFFSAASDSARSWGRLGRRCAALLANYSLEKKFYIATVVVVVSLALLAGLALEVVDRIKRHSEAVDHAEAVLIRLTALASDLARMERFGHDYRVSGSASHGDAFRAARRHAVESIEELRKLVPADVATQAQLRHMAELVTAQYVAAPGFRAGSGPQEAITMAGDGGSGWVSPIDEIQDLVDSMEYAEQLTLARRKSEERTSYLRMGRWAVAVGLMGCLLVALLLILVRYDLTAHRRAAKDLARSRQELDAKVKERTEELAAVTESLRQLSARLEVAREEERRRIAREIHDDLGSTLTALKIELSGTLGDHRASWTHRPMRRRASVDLVDSALLTVKQIVSDLRPGVLDHFGLWEALKCKAQQFEERTRIAVKLTLAPDLPSLPNEVSIAIFRVVEEALTNVARHAQATRVAVLVSQADDQIEVTIADNGRGITQEQLNNPESFGLLNMHERARHWGGEFLIAGRPGDGTTARLRVPVRDGR